MIEIEVFASSSAGNAYRVTDGRTPLLLDCGIGFEALRKACGFRLSAIAGCLLSHEHGDHAHAVKELLKAGVDVYTSKGAAEALGLSGHRLHVVEAKKPFQVGTWTVLPFDTVHDAAEPLGFLMASQTGKVLYLTDTAYCRYRFNGLTHIMIEANYSDELLRRSVAAGETPPQVRSRVLRNHMSIDRAIDMLQANDLSQVEEIWLIHLSDAHSDAEVFARSVREATGKPVYVAGKGKTR